MEFALLFYLDEANFAGMTPEENRKLQDDCRKEDEDLEKAGRLVIARALEAPSKAVTVSVRASKAPRTDGPFAETKEHLGGLVIVRVKDMEEALRLAESSPLARYGKVEVRPLYDIRAVA